MELEVFQVNEFSHLLVMTPAVLIDLFQCSAASAGPVKASAEASSLPSDMHCVYTEAPSCSAGRRMEMCTEN